MPGPRGPLRGDGRRRGPSALIPATEEYGIPASPCVRPSHRTVDVCVPLTDGEAPASATRSVEAVVPRPQAVSVRVPASVCSAFRMC